MTKAKKKILISFNLNTTLNKYIMAFVIIVGLLNIALFCSVFYDMKPKNIDEILNAVFGYYLLTGDFYANICSSNSHSKKDTEKLKHLKNGNICSYDIYPVLPIQRKDLLRIDFNYFKYTIIASCAALISTNIFYLLNDSLQIVSGFFVIMTIISILSVCFNFINRYFKTEFGANGYKLCIAAYTIIIFTNLIGTFSDKFSDYIMGFLGLKFFTPLAGAPMLIISVIYAPVLLFFYKKYVGKSKKSAAWY